MNLEIHSKAEPSKDFASHLGKNFPTSPQHHQVLAYYSNLNSDFSIPLFFCSSLSGQVFLVHVTLVLLLGLGAFVSACLVHSYLHLLQEGLSETSSQLKSLTLILRPHFLTLTFFSITLFM